MFGVPFIQSELVWKIFDPSCYRQVVEIVQLSTYSLFVSASLTIHTACVSALCTDLLPIPFVGLSVCLSVRKVYCGKTADWIRVPIGVENGVGPGIGVYDVGGDRQTQLDFIGAMGEVNFSKV